jgi:cytochrome o ubiquinol oxidase subunit IV
MAWIVALALVQLFIQLIFFLHLGRESKPRWNLSALAFAVIVVVILVFGSLWIMASLDYHGGHHSTPQTSDEYIIQDEGFHDH